MLKNSVVFNLSEYCEGRGSLGDPKGRRWRGYFLGLYSSESGFWTRIADLEFPGHE